MKNKTIWDFNIIQLPSYRLPVKKIQPQISETEKIAYFPDNK